MNIALLGLGAVGRITAIDLQDSSKVRRIVVVDNDIEKSKSFIKAKDLSKAALKALDISNENDIREAIKDSDVIVNVLPYVYNLLVMKIALGLNKPYVDLGGLFFMTRQQMELDEDFKKAKLTAIIGMGGAPGITNTFARYACDKLDAIAVIGIFDGGKENNPPKDAILRWGYSLDTILDETASDAIVFRDGEYIRVPTYRDGIQEYNFPDPIGRLRVDYCLHSELATIPDTYCHKGLREAFYKINFSNLPEEEAKKIRLLCDLGLAQKEEIDVKGTKIIPRNVLLALANRLPSIDTQGGGHESLCVVATGAKNGSEIEYEMQAVAHTDEGSPLTGIPPSIVAQWLATRTINEPGVFPPERIIEPSKLFDELKKRGITILSNIKKKL